MCVSKVHSIPAKFNTGEDFRVEGGGRRRYPCVLVFSTQSRAERHRRTFQGTILSHRMTFTNVYSTHALTHTHTHLSSPRDTGGIKRFSVSVSPRLLLPTSPQHVFLFLAVTPHPPQSCSASALHQSRLPFCLSHSCPSVSCTLHVMCVCVKRARDLVRDSPPNSM